MNEGRDIKDETPLKTKAIVEPKCILIVHAFSLVISFCCILDIDEDKLSQYRYKLQRACLSETLKVRE
jgi:hypothetical protein